MVSVYAFDVFIQWIVESKKLFAFIPHERSGEMLIYSSHFTNMYTLSDDALLLYSNTSII